MKCLHPNCGMACQKGKDYCIAHDPFPEALANLKKWRSAGGKAKKSKNELLESAKANVATVLRRLTEGTATSQDLHAAVAALNSLAEASGLAMLKELKERIEE